MSIFESIRVGIYGMGVVFLVLIILSVLMFLQSQVVLMFVRMKNKATRQDAVPTVEEDAVAVGIFTGELRLIDVDEKTAAMCMAIVSDETQIPLSQLIFKSIKLVD